MAEVQVTIKNTSDQTVTLTLDDERDAEQIEYYQTLKRREDLVEVNITKADGGSAKKTTGHPRKTEAAPAAETQP